jgi:hypothetical protein
VLTDEPLDEPPKKLQQALAAARISPERFFVMQHGQTRKLDDFAIRDAAVKLD